MLRKFGLHLGLIFACLLVVAPIIWIVRTSLVPESMSYSSDIFPGFSAENYVGLIGSNHFLTHYGNSLIVSFCSVLLAMPFAAATGYAFARFKTGGKSARFIMLATQMLPAVALVLPAFAVLRSLGLTNSLVGLTLVYTALNLPFLTWILMGFFEGIPVDLEWAAMTDGATAWGAFWHIVLPVSLPGLAAAGVLGFILSWNEFLFALVLSGPQTATIPVALAALQTSNGIQIGKVSAGIVLAILPLIIASHFIQRYIVKGLTFGGVK
ncbi:carbohydrate ABC transporter permease [Pectobacteriaceae bacterium CE70]|uniref:carbohydrate ABC transporter permease n=1 Tax=Brenneria uluponensis TaxID=3057057 RepID=UPI0025B34BD0|nr:MULTISPECIES: carbohydrate ABC transporter permease [Pectobacteriaceae]WJV56262.1 carbohydrate ABC transporter permease [Pectobacteriaceae bacterium C111]WJV60671.1 carbohydrate ABC transporter permease [Pectobacteriaceae bacterium C52]WJV68888.1 carbohydrate ABC transporter permease [Pectobacteriaceae bacterium CE70]WJY12811.1 carbohydrate ABC transporter permease [Pectobacteriaceae bacterium C80]WJY16941.1 carbohydrate ABC transporter permease [Pectobacteriaceae bacterium CE90]